MKLLNQGAGIRQLLWTFIKSFQVIFNLFLQFLKQIVVAIAIAIVVTVAIVFVAVAVTISISHFSTENHKASMD